MNSIENLNNNYFKLNHTSLEKAFTFAGGGDWEGALQVIKAHPELVNKKDQYGRTILWLAAFQLGHDESPIKRYGSVLHFFETLIKDGVFLDIFSTCANQTVLQLLSNAEQKIPAITFKKELLKNYIFHMAQKPELSSTESFHFLLALQVFNKSFQIEDWNDIYVSEQFQILFEWEISPFLKSFNYDINQAIYKLCQKISRFSDELTSNTFLGNKHPKLIHYKIVKKIIAEHLIKIIKANISCNVNYVPKDAKSRNPLDYILSSEDFPGREALIQCLIKCGGVYSKYAKTAWKKEFEKYSRF